MLDSARVLLKKMTSFCIFFWVFLFIFVGCDRKLVLAHQEIGECSTASRERGICVPQAECLGLDSQPANADFAETCKLSSDGTPFICCVARSTDSSTNSRRDNPPVQTRLKPINDEPDDNVNVPTSETEFRNYNIPRKKPTAYTKFANKVTPKPYYDQSTYSNYVPSRDNPRKSETKYTGNRPYNENDYASPNFQPNYYNYETVRPSESPPNRQNNEVIFRPRPSQQSTKPSSGPKPTRPSNNGNFGSSDVIHFPNENNHESGNINYPYNTNQPNNGQYESNQGYYPNQNGNRPNYGSDAVKYPNHGSTSQRPIQSARPTYGSSNADWGSSTYRPNGQNPRQSNNNNNRPNNIDIRPVTEENYGGNTPRATNRPQEQTQRISMKKCNEYARSVTATVSAIPLSIDSQATVHQVSECRHDAVSLIVGGTKAQLGEYPHMVALGFRSDGSSSSSIVYNCGGTLISEYFVLTAAHCIHSSLGEPRQVRLGDLNLEKDDDGAKPQNINVAKVIVHPNYKPPQLYNDIALVKLARKVSFHRDLRPACLQVKQSFDTKKVTATGWGSTNYGEVTSDDLLKARLDIINNKQCNTLYGPDSKLRNGITDTMLCAGELSGKRDTCQGDSGGPLQIPDPNNKCVHHVIGITSFGKSCGAANSPGIYTRVSEYVSWIEENVWPNERR